MTVYEMDGGARSVDRKNGYGCIRLTMVVIALWKLVHSDSRDRLVLCLSGARVLIDVGLSVLICAGNAVDVLSP